MEIVVGKKKRALYEPMPHWNKPELALGDSKIRQPCIALRQ